MEAGLSVRLVRSEMLLVVVSNIPSKADDAFQFAASQPGSLAIRIWHRIAKRQFLPHS